MSGPADAGGPIHPWPGSPATSSTLSKRPLRSYADPMRVAVCQLNSREDREANLAAAEALLERAAAAGADLALLPEFVDYLGPAAGSPSRSRSTARSASSSPASPGGWACG